MKKIKNKPNIILIGAGGHARSCIDVIEQNGNFIIVGLTGTQEELDNELMGYPIVGTDNDLPELAKKYEYAMITVGQIQSFTLRQSLYEKVADLGFILPSIISPFAHVSCHAEIGNGSIIMHGSIVNANAKVGNNCIINSNTLIEHDANIEDHSHISTGAIVNGGARIGLGSFIGSGSLIKQGITLGRECIVGMGLSIRHDYADKSKILKNMKT
jgi:sugar O-acyltransferase (sialic acid O-acetyltransferase NeuD family)